MFITVIHAFQAAMFSVDHFEWEVILCCVIWHLPRGFESYDSRSKFDSVLHTESDDVPYGYSAISVEFSGLSRSRSPSRCQRSCRLLLAALIRLQGWKLTEITH